MQTRLLHIFIILTLALSVLGIALPAAVPVAAQPPVQWEKTFGGASDDRGAFVQPTADGGYIIVGDTQSFGAGSRDVYLVKTDASGNMLWSQAFGGVGSDQGYSVNTTIDGGYIIVGNTYSFGAGGSDVYLIKTNSSGNMTWSQTFGGVGYEAGNSVRQTVDGGYIIGGTTGSFGNGAYDVYLIKTNSSGNMTWSKTFGGTGYEDGYSVQQTADNGYIIAGWTNFFGVGSEDVYLIKTDSSGNLTWQNTFGGAGDDRGYSVQPTAGGGYIIAGHTASSGAGGYDAYLVKTDASGNLTWSQTFGGTGFDASNSVQQTADGGYIVAGTTASSGAGLWDVYLIRTNSSGNMTWSQTFGGASNEMGNSVQPTADGGYIISGATSSFGAGGNDAYLVKLGPAAAPPTVNTDNATNITTNSAILNGTLSNLGTATSVSVSFQWGLTDNYTDETTPVSMNTIGAFNANLTGLSANTTYHFRAKASGDGIAYGADNTFTTAVVSPPAPCNEWSRRFGGTDDDDFGYSVQQTADGGYIIAGHTFSFGTGYYDVYLVKTDASGNLTWQKTFGGASDDLGYSVQQTTDGGYIIGGTTGASGTGLTDVYLIKTDASGNMTWSQTFGGANYEEGYSVRQTADGGYIIAGVTNSFGTVFTDVYLVKTNPSGNLTWSQTFGGGANHDYGYSVQQTADGGYIITGFTASFGAGSYDVYLIKTDASGNMTWSQTFGGAYQDIGYSVRQTADDGYIVTGDTRLSGAGDDVYLIKTNASGNLTWSQTFGGASDEWARSVEPTADGGYIIGGSTQSFGAGSQDVYLVKTNSSGNMTWQKTFGGAGYDRGYSVQPTADSGYIIAGWTSSFGAGDFDVYLIKVCPAVLTDTTPPIVTITSPNQDATILTSPVTVTVNASDDVGVTALTVNGVSATLIPGSGNLTGGVWQAFVPVSLPVSPGGALTFTAVATDAAGNTGTDSVTVDNDCIAAIIDTAPNAFSDNFTDVPLGGETFGSIADRAGWTVCVTELDNPAGVQVSISGAGNPSGARIVTGGTGAWAEETILQFAGETANITRIWWTAGTPPAWKTQVTAIFVSPPPPPHFIMVRTPPTPPPAYSGPHINVNLPQGQTGIIGSVAASPNNTEPIEVQVVDEQNNQLGSGLLPPGAAINIDFLPDGTFLFQNLSLTATLTFTMYGITFTLNPGESFQTPPMGVNVRINAPRQVAPGRGFTATVDIGQVTDLNGAQYDISFDPSVLTVDNVTAGQIGATVMPVQGFTQVSPGVYRVLQARLEPPYTVNGSGYLAALHFRVIGSLGASSTISLTNGILSGWGAEIPAIWMGDFVEVGVIPGDANGDGVVNVLDLTRVARIILGLDAETPGADANQDGMVDVLDLTKIVRIILGLD